MKEPTPADVVKNSVNLVDLIRGKGVSLKKVGRTFVGLCPFHKCLVPLILTSKIPSRITGKLNGIGIFSVSQQLKCELFTRDGTIVGIEKEM